MTTTQTILRQLGIHGTYKGYHYLKTSLEMLLEDEQNLSLYSKMVFPSVARKYHATPSQVERNIRTVIHHCWNCAGREKLLEIAPYTLHTKPTVSEFLDMLYWYLKFHQEQETLPYASFYTNM